MQLRDELWWLTIAKSCMIIKRNKLRFLYNKLNMNKLLCMRADKEQIFLSSILSSTVRQADSDGQSWNTSTTLTTRDLILKFGNKTFPTFVVSFLCNFVIQKDPDPYRFCFSCISCLGKDGLLKCLTPPFCSTILPSSKGKAIILLCRRPVGSPH